MSPKIECCSSKKMWQFIKLLAIFALILNSEAIPKKYNGIHKETLKSVKSEQEMLPTTIIPAGYNLSITVTEENLNSGNFTGDVTINLQLTDNLTEIVVHGKDITIESVKVDTEDVDHTDPDENDFIKITKSDKETAKVFLTGIRILNIKYSGKLSDTDMEGFYRSSYVDSDGKTAYLATTQFEQMGARRAFPCLDEPHLKSTFDITINYSEGYNAISNTAPSSTKEDKKETATSTTFETTPPMSTYLVAFIVSKFACTDGETTSGTVKAPTEICARPGLKTLDLAKETAPKALDVMAAYTGKLEYASLGNTKLTQAAIPDFAAGAMENWGLVTYREADLLSDDTESSNSDKQKIVTVITHELSHQWFGDYVTLDSWSDIFLNEGFATFFEYFAAAKLTDISDTWQLDKQFIIEQLQPVLLTDSSGDSKPLHFESNDPDVIESRFDDISYNKGGSIIRMVNHMLGDTNFKMGLGDYLDTNQHLTGSPESLWSSFANHVPNTEPEKLPTNLSIIMDNWINKPGYPLLTVTLIDTNLTITQEEFKLSGASETKWYVPITYTSDVDTESTTTTQLWLKPDEYLVLDTKDLKNLTWILLNNEQIGYYRVNYDKNLLKSIKSLLDTGNFTLIDEIKRSQLVDDQMNLARAGKTTYSDALDFITFLKNDDSYYSWYSAFNGLSYLLKRTATDEVKKALKEYIMELMETLVDSVPINTTQDNHIDTLKQVMAHTWSCEVGHSKCVEDAKTKYNDFKANDSNPVAANFRSFVYCTALANTENATEDFDFLYGKYQETDLASAKVTILKSLGCIKDADVRHTYLHKIFTEDIRIQDVRYVLQSVYTHDGVENIIDFISDHYAKFEERFGDNSQLISLISTIGDYISTQDQIDKLNTFAKTEGLDNTIKTAATTSATAAKTNLDVIKKLEETLKSYFKDDNSSASISEFSFFNFAFILMAYFMFNYY